MRGSRKFCQRGSNVDKFFLRIQLPLKAAIDCGPTLNADFPADSDQYCLETLYFVICQEGGGGPDPLSHHLDPRMLVLIA